MRASAFPILKADEIDTGDGLKPSLYNYFVDKGDKVWGINFRSMALVRLEPEQYRYVKNILDGAPIPTDSDRLETLRGDLIKGKFLVPRGLDELDLLKKKHWSNRFANTGLTLIIAPTLRCNFACEYCYVDLNANKMKPEDRVKVKKFFHNKLPENSPVTVVWTGGDPSLAMDVVEELSTGFLESCGIKNCNYSSVLITNAYLLDDKMREHLRKSNVRALQISLDGCKEFHDKSRFLTNGKPTYDVIMQNVDATCDEFQIYLRINVDSYNQYTIPELLDDIEARGLKRRVFLYYAHVDDVNQNSAGHKSACLSPREYAVIEAALLRQSLERGFRLVGHSMKPAHVFCGANSMNYYVIDSKANLLKCYHDYGQADELGIGKIGDDGHEVVTNPYNLLKWLGWDPFSIPECRDCKVLPICMGGCSHKIMNSGMDVDRGCVKMRFSMEEIVDIFGESLLQNREAASGCRGCAATATVTSTV